MKKTLTILTTLLLAGCTSAATLPPTAAPVQTETTQSAVTPTPAPKPRPTEPEPYNAALYAPTTPGTHQIMPEANITGLFVMPAPNGKLGYADSTGMFIIPPIYDFAEPFDENSIALASQAGGWRFIDPQNERISDLYTYVAKYDGYYHVAYATGREAILDETLSVWMDDIPAMPAELLENGYTIIVEDGLYGLFSLCDNEITITPQYTALHMDDELALLAATCTDGRTDWLHPETGMYLGTFTVLNNSSLIPVSSTLLRPADNPDSLIRYISGLNGEILAETDVSALHTLARGVYLLSTEEADTVVNVQTRAIRKFPAHSFRQYYAPSDGKLVMFLAESRVYALYPETGRWMEANGTNALIKGNTAYAYGEKGLYALDFPRDEVRRLSAYAITAAHMLPDGLFFTFQTDGKEGVCDDNGTILLGPIYDEASPIETGLLRAVSGGVESYFARIAPMPEGTPPLSPLTGVDYSLPVEIPLIRFVPGTKIVLINGVRYQLEDTFELNDDVYFPLASLQAFGLPFSAAMDTLRLGGLSLVFAPGETGVTLNRFNPETRLFETESIETTHSFVHPSDHWEFYFPLQTVAEILELRYNRDAETGIITFGGCTVRCTASGVQATRASDNSTALDWTKVKNALLQLDFAPLAIDGTAETEALTRRLYARHYDISAAQANTLHYNTAHELFARLTDNADLLVLAPLPEDVDTSALELAEIAQGYYAMYAADAPENSAAREAAAYLLTKNGQKLIAECGLVPIL